MRVQQLDARNAGLLDELKKLQGFLANTGITSAPQRRDTPHEQAAVVATPPPAPVVAEAGEEPEAELFHIAEKLEFIFSGAGREFATPLADASGDGELLRRAIAAAGAVLAGLRSAVEGVSNLMTGETSVTELPQLDRLTRRSIWGSKSDLVFGLAPALAEPGSPVVPAGSNFLRQARLKVSSGWASRIWRLWDTPVLVQRPYFCAVDALVLASRLQLLHCHR